jgi:hypothetical protein
MRFLHSQCNSAHVLPGLPRRDLPRAGDRAPGKSRSLLRLTIRKSRLAAEPLPQADSLIRAAVETLRREAVRP